MFITTVCVLFLIKLSQVIDPLVLLFVVILFLSFFHISNCTVSKQRSFIRQKLCHDIDKNSNSDSCHQIESNITGSVVNEANVSWKDSVIGDKLQVLVQAFYTLPCTYSECLCFIFLIKYFFFFGWYLLLSGRFSSCVCHVVTESFWPLDAKKKEITARRITRINLTFREYISMPHCMPFNTFMAFLLASGVTVISASPRFGHPHSKTLVMWVSPLTLIQIATVVWEGDACIATVLGMGMPKTQGCLYHCHTGGNPLILLSRCAAESSRLWTSSTQNK